MILPTQLSENALSILRQLAQSGLRKSGSVLFLDSIERSWKRSQRDLEVGLADLEIARLVLRIDEGVPRVSVTNDGEAFFARFYWSCHSG